MQEKVLKEFSEKKISSKGYEDGSFQPYEFKRHAVGEREMY